MYKDRRKLLLVAFISGMAIMAMEVSAARLLAPYFGTSAFVWTNVIGVVLIALSLGYFLGGKLADKKPDLKLLGKLFIVAGIIFLLAPYLVRIVADFLLAVLAPSFSIAFFIFAGSLLVTIFLFGIPLVILGMVSPLLIKLYAKKQEDQVGEVAGSIFAVSTLGSLIGTFLPTLLLIPWQGTKFTIWLFAIVLLLLGIIVDYRGRKTIGGGFLLLIILFVISSFFYSHTAYLYEDESFYQYIKVKEEGPYRYLLFNEGMGIQSVFRVDSVLTDFYYDYFNLLPYLFSPQQKVKVLIVGLAGGTISRSLLYFFPRQVEIDGVEIDKKVINIGRKFFALSDPRLNIFHQDGRVFLRLTQNQYDIIIIDAYSNELYIPWTMTTYEFWELVKQRLKPGGLVAFNVSTTKESGLLSALAQTVKTSFANTYIIDLPLDYNVMILASQRTLPLDKIKDREVSSPLDSLVYNFVENAKLVKQGKKELTDDHAPVEYLTNLLIWREIKKSIVGGD